MRQLFPVPIDEVDPLEAHESLERNSRSGRAWVMLNMVASVDGAISIDGVSAQLGGPSDKATFSALRAMADVVLAGAGTVRAENYGPPRTPPLLQDRRLERGQSRFPRIAVVSASLDLDATSSMFTEAHEAPIVVTCSEADPTRLGAFQDVAEVVTAGSSKVDLAKAVHALHSLGADIVLCEGGPTLNGQLLDLNLIDEVNLTISPQLVGGNAKRITNTAHATTRHLELGHLWHDPSDDLLLARYVRRPQR